MVVLERIVGREVRCDVIVSRMMIGVRIRRRRMIARSSSSCGDVRARHMMDQRQQVIDFGTKSPYRQRGWHNSFRRMTTTER
jgi:hypothetical protein